MPESLSTTIVLALFYAVFASQIYLISIYYAGKLSRRREYVHEHFPPARYPKLYPPPLGAIVEAEGKQRLRLFRAINYAIALLGAAILVAMAFSGYQPDLKGGDEIFVLMYFFLQFCPILYAELQEFRTYRLMRRTFAGTQRRASLEPRRLFDFVSPVSVGMAIVLYWVWLAYYLSGKGPDARWGGEVLVTVVVMTGMNLVFAIMIAKSLKGKKADPYQAHDDRLKQIAGAAKVLVGTSIGVSVFSIITQAVDQYGLEIFDPALTSVYLQVCAAFGLGFMFQALELGKIDFEVYRDDGDPASS